jgi:hypothetical protein
VAAFLDLLPLAGAGALSALVAAGAKSHRWQLPRVIRENTAEGGSVVLIDLGFLAAPLLGALCGVAAGSGIERALWAGLAAGIAGPAVLNALLEPLLGKLGLPAAAGSDGATNG